MKQNITENNYNRLATSLMEKHEYDYDTAVAILNSFKLLIICGPAINHSIPLQAALVTAANAGKRAFLGGVSVRLSMEMGNCLLPPFKGQELEQVLSELGVRVRYDEADDGSSFILTIGVQAMPGDRCLEVVCNSWQGGVAPADAPVILPYNGYLSLGGVAAGAIGVGLAFLIVSGIDERCADKPGLIMATGPGLADGRKPWGRDRPITTKVVDVGIGTPGPSISMEFVTSSVPVIY